MKVTADTNVLIRAAVQDDEQQAAAAQQLLLQADVVVITLPVLCELAWVLSRGYRTPTSRIVGIIRDISNAANVVTDRSAVDAGLEMLADGGDFADGVIAHEGAWLGAEEFVSFDKAAIKLLTARGRSARLL